jgi:hypothetical protein
MPQKARLVSVIKARKIAPCRPNVKQFQISLSIAHCVSALLSISCDYLTDKMPKNSRFFPGRIFLRNLKLPFKLNGNCLARERVKKWGRRNIGLARGH